MRHYQRWPKILLASSLLLLCLWVGWQVTTPALADVGVRPILPGGSSIQPEGETPVQMAAEKVVMTVRQATEADNAAIQLNPQSYGYPSDSAWYQAVAEVQADFTMNNPTSQAVSLVAWFPLASALEKITWEINPDESVPRIASFQVSADGSLLEVTESELPNPKGADKPLLPWASFPITFAGNQATNIHVSYLLPLQPSAKGYEMSLYYIFQTGAGWAGSIGQAELVLNLPYPASSETLMGIPAGGFNPPYMAGGPGVELPAGAVLEGNQARWTWTDFEPGPENDFAVWLIQPERWQAIQEVRQAVQADPQDPQAWLNLASLYHSVAASAYAFPMVFSNTYLPLGIEAYQKAIELMPEHPAPHAGLALLTLSPYMRDLNASEAVLQTVEAEMETARGLEAADPTLAGSAFVSSAMVEDALELYQSNLAAAQQTTETPIVDATSTPLEPTATSTAVQPTKQSPTKTPTLIPTAAPLSQGGQEMIFILLIVVGVILLVCIGLLISLRRPGQK